MAAVDAPGIILTIFVLLVGLLATAGYGLMSVAQYNGARIAFVATALFFFAIGIELGLVMAWPLPVRIFVAGCFGFAAAGSLVYAFHSISLLDNGPKAGPELAGYGFYIECNRQLGPIKMPSIGLYSVGPSENGGDAFGHLPITDPSQEGKDYKFLDNMTIEALQCKLTNYEQLPALDVILTLTIAFSKVVRSGIVVTPGEIVEQRNISLRVGQLFGKVDPGAADSFTFYIANRSDKYGMSGTFAPTISARLLNEQGGRSFQLTSNPTDFLLPESPFPPI